MMMRLFDVLFSFVVLILVAPLFLVTAVAIKLTSPGPIFYLAERMGRHEKPFLMYKFRSMHVTNGGSVITSADDKRIFKVGQIIRALKIDELPQFLNVIKGDMGIVGPRPEAPQIVRDHYTPWMKETFNVRPGLTSPGAIFYYAYGEAMLHGDNAEQVYVDILLAPKLALELAHAQHASVGSNVVVVVHTALAIFTKAIGKPIGPRTRDIAVAAKWYPEIARMCA